MPDHHGHDARINQRLEDPAVSGEPFFTAERVQTGDIVLVAEIHAVAGEVLGTCRNSVVLNSLCQLDKKTRRIFRIVSDGADIRDRIIGIEVEVGDGSADQVDSRNARFFGHDSAEFITCRGIKCRAEIHHARHFG